MTKPKNYLPEKNDMIVMFIGIMSVIVEAEIKFIKRKGFLNFLLSRLISIFAMFISVYIISAVVFAVGITITTWINKNQSDFNYDYWWTIPLLSCLPFLITIVLNFNNRKYIFGKNILNFLEVIQYSIPRVNSYKTYFEGIFFIVFISIFTFLQIYALPNFIDSATFEMLINKEYSIFIFLAISVTIYITVRVFGMAENTLQDSFNKSKRLFLLWVTGSVITLIYLIYSFLTLKENLTIYFPYLVITLLLAIEKAKDSYKKLADNLKNLLEL